MTTAPDSSDPVDHDPTHSKPLPNVGTPKSPAYETAACSSLSQSTRSGSLTAPRANMQRSSGRPRCLLVAQGRHVMLSASGTLSAIAGAEECPNTSPRFAVNQHVIA